MVPALNQVTLEVPPMDEGKARNAALAHGRGSPPAAPQASSAASLTGMRGMSASGTRKLFARLNQLAGLPALARLADKAWGPAESDIHYRGDHSSC